MAASHQLGAFWQSSMQTLRLYSAWVVFYDSIDDVIIDITFLLLLVCVVTNTEQNISSESQIWFVNNQDTRYFVFLLKYLVIVHHVKQTLFQLKKITPVLGS